MMYSIYKYDQFLANHFNFLENINTQKSIWLNEPKFDSINQKMFLLYPENKKRKAKIAVNWIF